MERRRHFRWDRLFECIVLALVFLFVAWVFISYINIIMHNSTENPSYFRWNLFMLYYPETS